MLWTFGIYKTCYTSASTFFAVVLHNTGETAIFEQALCITIANCRNTQMKVRIRGNAVKRILARKNLSQNWLAMRVETSTGYMSQLMTGVRNPSAKMRSKILDVLKDCQFDDVFVIVE